MLEPYEMETDQTKTTQQTDVVLTLHIEIGDGIPKTITINSDSDI